MPESLVGARDDSDTIDNYTLIISGQTPSRFIHEKIDTHSNVFGGLL